MPKKVKQCLLFEKLPRKTKVSYSKKNASATQYTRELYSTLNRYFWSRDIGFKTGMNCTRKHFLLTLISIFCALLIDGNIIVKLSSYFKLLNSTEDKKAILSMSVIMMLNLYNRILLYTRRKKLKMYMQKLAGIYDKIGQDGMLVKFFKRKLILVLTTHDVIYFVVLPNLVYPFLQQLFIALYEFKPLPLSLLESWLKLISVYVALTHTPVTAYFCSVCFLLKESLTALSNRLQNAREESLETLFDVHCEISRTISSLNDFLDPHLVITSSLLLFAVFVEVYSILFEENPANITIVFRILCILLNCFHFVFMCLSGTYVANAAAQVRATAQTLPVKFSGLRSLHVVSTMKECIEGFKMLNSIVIDRGLILTTVCSLLSYGILIATLDLSKEARSRP